MFESIAAHDLQGIQFLVFMGGSNSTHARSNLHAFYSNKYGDFIDIDIHSDAGFLNDHSPFISVTSYNAESIITPCECYG